MLNRPHSFGGGCVDMEPMLDLGIAAPVQLHIPSHAITRFQGRIVRTVDCWFFVGAISSPDGYGRFTFTTGGKKVTLSAHRFAALIAYNVLPPTAIIEHRCNEPLCVRVHPEHVCVSTQADNLAWAVASGRAAGPKKIVDSNRRVERSRAVRQLLHTGWNEQDYAAIINAYSTLTTPTPNPNQMTIEFNEVQSLEGG